MSERLDFPQPYRGTTERPKPILTLAPVAPWDSEVTVTRIDLRGYTDPRWEILARWHGPPLPGTPTPPPGVRVHARDSLHVLDRQGAIEVARRAHEQLGNGVVPDLRELSRTVLRRAGAAPALNLE